MSLISVPNDWFGDGNNGYHTRVAMNLIESLGGVNLSSRFINDEMSFLSFEGGDGCLRDRVHEEEDEEKTSRLHTLAKKPISVDVENILGRPDEHENSDGGGDELRRGKGDSKPAPHPGSQLGLDHLHPRHPNHITTHSLHIDRREIEESPKNDVILRSVPEIDERINYSGSKELATEPVM